MDKMDNPYANFIDQLSPQSRKWFALAIAGSVTSDGLVDDKELQFLKVAINFLEEREEIEGLVSMAKDRRVPKLNQLRGQNRIVAFKMFLALAKITAADNVITPAEKDYVTMVGGKLGFRKDLIKKVLDWLDLSIELNVSKELIKKKEKNLNAGLNILLSQALKAPEEFN